MDFKPALAVIVSWVSLVVRSMRFDGSISFMGSYLIHHPRRSLSVFGDLKVYHDPIGGNQDPYIWKTQFLHTYCHITQIELSSLVPKDLIFWVSGDRFPQFSHGYV